MDAMDGEVCGRGGQEANLETGGASQRTTRAKIG